MEEKEKSKERLRQIEIKVAKVGLDLNAKKTKMMYFNQKQNTTITATGGEVIHLKNNFMVPLDGVQLPQGLSHLEKAVYFLPLSPQKFLVLTLSISEG